MRCGTTTKKPISHTKQQIVRKKKQQQQQCSFFVCFFVCFCFLESWFGLRPPAAAPTQRKRKGKEKRHWNEGSQGQNLDHATSTDDDDNKRGNLRKSQRVNKQIAIQKWEVKWTKTCKMCQREETTTRGASFYTFWNQIHHYRDFQDCQIHHQSFQSHHQRVFKIARFNI
ncbi:hypothetical protein CY35_07G017500 [Sphagnum magellanicum]|uniref:Uncharacterized protein n=1 Tax=Sphagnum magellanicum TaxID=128215 RepID=A0ACB8HJ73_9BRYO|nr:hypothetical protein CY35_07G017500 [Sphagnum magellanicum]